MKAFVKGIVVVAVLALSACGQVQEPIKFHIEDTTFFSGISAQ